jgi:hypothetical protein
MSGDMVSGVAGAGELPPMSIPGMSCGIGASVGAGELPPISIPGMSCGMAGASVGAGVLPDISIPGMSAGMLAVGAGGSSDPTATVRTAALSGVEAEATCCDMSMSDPRTVIPATVAPTDATRIRRRRRASLADRLQLVWLIRSSVLLMVIRSSLRGVMMRAWAVFTAQVFSITFGSVSHGFPPGLYEGFVKFLRSPHRQTVPNLGSGGPFLGKPSRNSGQTFIHQADCEGHDHD